MAGGGHPLPPDAGAGTGDQGWIAAQCARDPSQKLGPSVVAKHGVWAGCAGRRRLAESGKVRKAAAGQSEAAIRAHVCMKLIQKTSPPKDRPLHSAKKPRSAKSWRQDFLHGKASPKPLARGACGGSHSCFVVANSGFPLVPEDIFTPLACREKVVVLGRTVYPSYSFLAVQTE